MAAESSKAESIFFAALENPSAEARSAYLEQACGPDTKLRRRVEKMLAAEPHVGTFLEVPIADPSHALDSARAQEGPGAVIGAYKLLQEIGEGGFGVVYMAEQLKPIRRNVALKIIKPGMDTREVIARFEAERQALAMMDHANIARVFDAGATESGRPYFVMELVRGVPITEFCDKNNFGTTKRLELFMAVCQAVQHAHLKGVVHRDLKPSNIMVTLHDGVPVPKVIDFGVAKAISQRLTEKTLFTRYGQMIGTPQYMSPEQAEMSGLDVDTRSDIYALGVLLYELLTGTTPLDAERVRTAAYHEMLQMIQLEEPVKPSTRVSTLGDSLTVICEHRKTDAKTLRKSIRGDLDWIVMKALEKHRDRRYETANEFAQDIQRHLDHEPVIAGPPSATYLLSKLARRNKALFTTAAIVLAALVTGLGLATIGFLNANYHRGIAERGRKQAEAAERDATNQRSRAQKAQKAAEFAGKQASDYADILERQNYNLHLAAADRAVLDGAFADSVVELESCPPQHRGWEWSFVKRQLDAITPLSFKGTSKPIFTPNGAHLIYVGVPGSEDELSVLVRDIASGSIVGKYEVGHKVRALALSLDGKRLAVGGDNGELSLWDTVHRQVIWTRNEHQLSSESLAFSPDGLIASADANGLLKVFESTDGSVKFELDFADPAMFSPQSLDASTRGSPTAEPLELRHQIQKVMFSADGKWMAIGSRLFANDGERTHVNHPAIIIDVATGAVAAEFETGCFLPTFSSDNRTIATAQKDEGFSIVLWIWDGNTLTQKSSWQVSDNLQNPVVDFEFSADGKRLAALTRRNQFSVWNVETRQQVATWLSGLWRANWLTMHPTKNLIAIYDNDRRIRVWNYAPENREVTRVKLSQPATLIKFSPNSERIAVGLSAAANETETQIKIVDVASGIVLNSFTGSFSNAPWFPDNLRFAVSRSPANQVEIVNALSGKLVRSLDVASEGDIWSFVSADGRMVTTVGRDRWIRTWNTETGLLLNEPFQIGGNIGWTRTSVDVNPETNRIAIGTESRTIEIWKDALSANSWRTLKTEGKLHFVIRWSLDGNRLFIGELGNAGLVVHDCRTQREVEVRPVSGEYAISPLGDQIVAPDNTGRSKVWDVQTGQPLITLTDKPGQLDWSPDGKRLAATAGDELYIWTLPPRP